MSNSTQQAIDWTPIYESLADDTRRMLLQFLTETTGAVDVVDIVDYLLDVDEQPWTDERAAQLELRLYHVHLPRLADAELVQWDPGQETVSLTDLGLQLPVAILRPQPIGQPSMNAPEHVGD